MTALRCIFAMVLVLPPAEVSLSGNHRFFSSLTIQAESPVIDPGQRSKRDVLKTANYTAKMTATIKTNDLSQGRTPPTTVLKNLMDGPPLQPGDPGAQLPPPDLQNLPSNPLDNGSHAQADFLPSPSAAAIQQYERPEHMTQTMVNDLVLLHNSIRSSILPNADQMLKMSWDYRLEANAWNYIKKCVFNPSHYMDRAIENFPTVGENLWVGWGTKFDLFQPETAITSWMKEQKYFDASLRSCIGGACENYVQLIWSMSYKVGCAWSECDTIDVHGYKITGATFFACHYAPGRNEAPFVPYYHGITCSFCDKEDTCELNLCVNPDREEDGLSTVPPTIDPFATTTLPFTEEARIALIVIGSVVGSTLVLTIAITILVRCARRRAEGQLSDHLKNFNRRLTLWYDNKLHPQQFNNVEELENQEAMPVSSATRLPSRASIDYHANLWND